MIKVLMLVDHAVGISGPHRNVVGSLNALSARTDVDLRLLTGKIDETEIYASRCRIQLGFDPHNTSKILINLRTAYQAVKDRDLIYVPTGLKSFLYAFAVKGRRKLVVGPNVTNLPLPGRKDHPGMLELKFMANHWIEASKARQNHVIRYTHMHSISVIHHAIDSSKFSPSRRDKSIWNRYGIPEDRIKIIYVGNDYALLKGVEVLIKAIQIVNTHKDLAQRLVFVFAGNLSARNQEKLSEIENAYALGFLTPDILPIIMASADISVVPSSWENFPFSVLEAMSSGLPIIAGHVGGIPEQIISGESGILIDIAKHGLHLPDASNRLAQALMLLADRPKQWSKLGQAARNRALLCFNEERLGQDLVDTFIQCLGK